MGQIEFPVDTIGESVMRDGAIYWSRHEALKAEGATLDTLRRICSFVEYPLTLRTAEKAILRHRLETLEVSEIERMALLIDLSSLRMTPITETEMRGIRELRLHGCLITTPGDELSHHLAVTRDRDPLVGVAHAVDHIGEVLS
jgi:hypothetical protein